MNRITLHEEYRLIERSESEVNGIWKGAHLLLFFLAFVFGSFCTFCFHMLMYLFDEKCVLFPKLLSLTSMRQNILNSFLAENEDPEALPVDFVSTQWVEKSACYLPTYVPLVSGIFGLVWTTMFLMCSSGSRTLTGLQQPWRIIPPVFIFSLAMGCLCTYTSIVTYNGLQELCLKLGEITGSKTCTFAVNVATLAYERRIRGVYQATRLTIFTAWMHTACWLLAALLALVRILLVVDFRLVRVRAELRGNVEKMLERHEQQLRTVSPDFKVRDEITSTKLTPSQSTDVPIQIRFHNKSYADPQQLQPTDSYTSINTIHYVATESSAGSEMALLPEEEMKLDYIKARKHRLVIQIIDDILDNIELSSDEISEKSLYLDGSQSLIVRQVGQRRITSKESTSLLKLGTVIDIKEAEERAKAFRRNLQKKMAELQTTSQMYESKMNITPELERAIRRSKKSNLKAKGNQTENSTKSKATQQKVQIADWTPYQSSSEETLKPLHSDEGREQEDEVCCPMEDQIVQTQTHETQDKETQTPKKEKQD